MKEENRYILFLLSAIITFSLAAFTGYACARTNYGSQAVSAFAFSSLFLFYQTIKYLEGK